MQSAVDGEDVLSLPVSRRLARSSLNLPQLDALPSRVPSNTSKIHLSPTQLALSIVGLTFARSKL